MYGFYCNNRKTILADKLNYAYLQQHHHYLISHRGQIVNILEQLYRIFLQNLKLMFS